MNGNHHTEKSFARPHSPSTKRQRGATWLRPASIESALHTSFTSVLIASASAVAASKHFIKILQEVITTHTGEEGTSKTNAVLTDSTSSYTGCSACRFTHLKIESTTKSSAVVVLRPRLKFQTDDGERFGIGGIRGGSLKCSGLAVSRQEPIPPRHEDQESTVGAVADIGFQPK
ncbi:hypothetical protein MTO96_030977 [Rhipicephalus appendiculatus]